MGYKTTQATLQAKLGVKVARAAADIINGAQVPLFNILAGKILLTHLEMEISVAAVDAGASNCQFLTTPTTGAAMALCANLNVISSVIGSVFSISGLITDALTGLPAGGGAAAMHQGVVVPIGTIDILTSADRGTGGALGAVRIWYLPLDAGAYVTAT